MSKKPSSDQTPSIQVKKKLEKLGDSIRVTQITSSFSMEARHDGLGSVSHVSYTIEPGPEKPSGWTLQEGRIAEAMLARRVSKDLYADLGAREMVKLPQIAALQKAVNSHYGRLIDALGSKLPDDESVMPEGLEPAGFNRKKMAENLSKTNSEVLDG